MGGRVGKTVAMSGKKRTTDSFDRAWLKIILLLVPRSHIQYERTSFPASFTSLAGRKNICHTLDAFCLPHDNATALYWHEKLTHMTERETNILTHTQDPHSVWENFVSCLFHKLSQQEKHFSMYNWQSNISIYCLSSTLFCNKKCS